jgi:hypothetical protein
MLKAGSWMAAFLFVECLHLAHDALSLSHVGDGFVALRTKVSRHSRDDGGFTFVGVGQIAGVMDQFGCTARRAFHGHNSFKRTISTSAMSVGSPGKAFNAPILADVLDCPVCPWCVSVVCHFFAESGFHVSRFVGQQMRAANVFGLSLR